MDVWELYDKYSLKICHCKLGRRYFDPIRNMYIHITPEESIRQKTCQILEQEFGVPRATIKIEDDLTHYGVKNKRGRIDIAIIYSGKKGVAPLAVIECKEERVSVQAQQVIDQAYGYAKEIGAPYFIVTNGFEMNFYHVDHKVKAYKPIDGHLTYENLLSGEITFIDKRNDSAQTSYDEIIGEDTDPRLIPSILDLSDCLYDESHRLSRLTSDSFRILEDLGVQYRKYSDASGGGFGTGEYRVIRLMETKRNRELCIGFSMTCTGKVINDPKYGTTDGKSVLVVMKNDGDRDEMAVQINLNQCLIVDETRSTLIHNALITRKGKTRQGLIDYIRSRSPRLLHGDQIVLGTLDTSRDLYMENNDVVQLISNAIEYAVYRDEYKHSK